MKRFPSLLVLVGLLALFSCKKDKLNADGLQGSWQMVLIKDLATGTVTAKPTTEKGEVTITFCCNVNALGQFTGNTPANIFSGVYKNVSAQLFTVESYGGTKVLDAYWGNTFNVNFTEAQSYSFDDNGRLQLHSPQKTLVFQRL